MCLPHCVSPSAHCCLYTYAYVYIRVNVLQRCVCVHVGERVCACMHGCAYRGIHVCVNVHVDVCTHVDVCVYITHIHMCDVPYMMMYRYIAHIYQHTHTQRAPHTCNIHTLSAHTLPHTTYKHCRQHTCTHTRRDTRTHTHKTCYLHACSMHIHTSRYTERETDFGYTICTLPSMLHTLYTPRITNTIHMLKRRNQKKFTDTSLAF
jgi:hypothetical protein